MKGKPIGRILTLLIGLGAVVFLVAQPDAQTAEDPWEAWIDEQTDIALKSATEIDGTRHAKIRASIRAKFSALAMELKNEIASPPQTQDYAILQTAKELQDTYDAGYESRHADTTVNVTYSVNGSEIFAYNENTPLAEVDAKYPREVWLGMLLDKGIKIENANAYWEYLFMRVALVHIEKKPHVWTSGLFGIPPAENWETYKAAYIERKLDQIQKHLKEEDKRVWIFGHTPEEHHSLLEKDTVLQKVFEDLSNRSKGTPAPVFRYFSAPYTVKSLREAYDEKYNERYAITSGNFSITQDGTTVFAYKFPLLLSEVDAKYPRDAWLQMLLEKGVTIDNFEEYWAYLSKRDTLVELENQPEIWGSGLFDIPPTGDWETYKAAYLKQMVEELHHRGHNMMGHYVDRDRLNKAKVEAEAIEKRMRKQFQHPLTDR